ncbi:MAG: DUF2934 domain-containing protein [Leptospiraceae bacterium]|nr:DUF2934 domain-containing protein [Leptospiraceae bacterium]
MPYDITFCGGGNCPLKENCLRFTGIAFGRQDFFGNIPYDFVNSNCDYFWDDRPSEDKIRLLAYQLWQKEGQQQEKDLEYWLEAQSQLIINLRNS